MDVVVIPASRPDSGRDLRIGIDGVTRLLSRRLRNDLHRVTVTVYNGCRAIKPAVEQVLLAHLFERAKRTALVRVEKKHLLLGNRAQGFDGRRLICSLDRGPVSRYSDSNQNADDCDNDHQLDKRKAALILFGIVKGFHKLSSGTYT